MNSDIQGLSASQILLLRDRAVTATQISVIIVDANRPNMPIIDANEAFQQLTGYTFDEVAGQNCRMLQGPQTDPQTIEIMRKAIKREEEVSVTILNYRKDGSAFWNQVHISPARDENGRVSHFVGVQSDATERKQIESNRDLLVEATGILTGVQDPDEAIRHISRLVVPALADVCIGYLHDETGSQEDESPFRFAAVESSTDDLAQSALRQFVETPSVGDAFQGLEWVLKSGETTWIPSLQKEDLERILDEIDSPGSFDALVGCSLVMTPIASPERIYGCLVLLIDIRQRSFTKIDVHLIRDLGRRIGTAFDNLRLYEQAQDAIRARDAFLSTAAHELRTPIVSIKGYAQFLLRSVERDTLTADRLKVALATIEGAVSRLTTLTDDLLSVSHRNLDHLPLHREPVNIHSYLDSFFSEEGPAAQKGYRTTVSIENADVWVHIDVERFHQVLTILLSNAIKFSPDGTPVFVHAESDYEGVTLTISDLGVGLLPGEEFTIFEPFGRTEEAIRDHLSGLGIGLFIARTIIERHEGKIWATSPGRGLGTSISTWLPAIETAIPSERRPAT